MRTLRAMLLIATTATIALTAAASRPAHAADPAQVAALKRALQAAVNEGSAEGILAVRARFDSLSAAEPKNALLHYWVAACDWRAAPFFMTGARKPTGRQWVSDGIARAGRAFELDPKFADALALRCGLQGQSIQLDPSQAMRLGMRAESDMGLARDLAPRNPRVLLLDGINTLNKPGFVGGGPGPALDKLEQARALFAAETVTDPAAPDWGKDDVWVWSGQAAVKAGDWKGARGYYQKALAANPGNGWVKRSLLPAVERKIAAQSGS